MTAPVPAPRENQGQPIQRVDARRKVLGEVRYAADFPATNPLHAVLVTSTVARGRITGFDLAAAEAVPGVRRIYTHNDLPPSPNVQHFTSGGHFTQSWRPMSGPDLHHEGEIVAIVVAETIEAAREGAMRVRVAYDAEPPRATFGDKGVDLVPVAEVVPDFEAPSVGDADAALADAPVAIEADYATPTQHHNPMELFATTVVWDGPRLTVYEPSQFVYGLREALAEALEIDHDRVHVVNPFVGGAFGSKGIATPRAVLLALIAREENRPVKCVVSREDGFTVATYRAENRYRVRLGADADGRLRAVVFEGDELVSQEDTFFNDGPNIATRMYASPNIRAGLRIARADRQPAGFMRAPAETPSFFALESAMDELAHEAGLDPIELRRANDTMTDPVSGNPFTSRSLMRCYDEAAAMFGWDRRNPEPGQTREGEWLVGYGCATATYPTLLSPAAARVRLTGDGEARVETACHDVGTGAYTVIAQAAALGLGIDPAAVTVALGDTDLPPGPVAGGSITTASAVSAVEEACARITRRLADRAVADGGLFEGGDAGALRLNNGTLRDEQGTGAPLLDAFQSFGTGAIEEYVEYAPPGFDRDTAPGLYRGNMLITGGPGAKASRFAFGAQLVEVRVHERTREVRVPRAVGAFACGRIMNPRTAHSQLMGGMIWGIGAALHEATEIDRREGRYVNDNIAEYLVPVCADVPEVHAIMVPETDPDANPAGVKGVGEVGIVGMNAAIANAVFNATGRRVRELPIRVEGLL